MPHPLLSRQPFTAKGKVVSARKAVNLIRTAIAPYTEMVRGLEQRFYTRVTRYTTSGFMRRKLGHALEARAVSPHISESAEEPEAHLGDRED